MFHSLAAFVLGAVLALAPATIPTASIQPLQIANTEGGDDRTICTAFSINEQAKYWATAAHCVLQDDDEGHTHVRQVRMGNLPVTVMHVNALLDIAVMRAGVSAPAIKLGARPVIGDPIRVYGYMWGAFTPTLFNGTIAALNIEADGAHYTLFDMRVAGGHSGSPILDASGAVVSVMQIGAGGFSGGALYGYLDELLPYWE
jgi:hypothetical protein